MSRQQKPAMESRLAGRLREKKALLDRYRPLPAGTVARLHEDLKVLSTYHSNAIEGNTLSLHETQMVVEYGMTVGGHSLREYQEAANHARAYEYVVALISGEHKTIPVTQDVILTIHRLIMTSILDDFQVGQWPVVPISIRGSNMSPPPARDVPRLMGEWEDWVNGSRGKQYEPVTRAAIAHHGFEAVHPFVDGNGRVGRLLLNLMLMREDYPPALLLKDWRIRYIHGLNEANTGQYSPLVNLVGQAVESCLDLYLQACATTPVPEEEDYLPLSDLAREFGYDPEYLSWLARYSRLEALKRGRRWYARRQAVEQYRREAEQPTQRQPTATPSKD